MAFYAGSKNDFCPVLRLSGLDIHYQFPSPKVLVEEYAQHEIDSLKNRLGVKGRGGSQADYNLSHLGHFFEQTYTQVKDAKKLYKQNQNRKEWRDIVRISYPELPHDLLERLSKTPNLSDEILSKLAEKGGTSAPSDIALEYSARLCGVPPYRYTIRHLKDTLSGQRVRESVKIVKSKRLD